MPSASKLVFGCRLCKRGITHTHEPHVELARSGLYNDGIFSLPRAKQLEEALRKTFFPLEPGPICTYRKQAL